MKSLFATKTMTTRVFGGPWCWWYISTVICLLSIALLQWSLNPCRQSSRILSIHFFLGQPTGRVTFIQVHKIPNNVVLHRVHKNARECEILRSILPYFVLLKLQEVPESSDAKERLSVVRSLTSWKHCSRRPDIQTSLPEKKLPSKSTYPSPECRLYASLFVIWSRDT